MSRVATAYGSWALGAVTALLSNLWLLRLVAAETDRATFGLYSFVITAGAYLAMLQLGLDTAVGQRMAQAVGRGDFAAAARVYRQLAWLNRYAVVAVLVLTAAAAAVAAAVVGPGLDPATAAALVVFTGANQAVLCLARAEVAALGGGQRLAAVHLVRVAGLLVTMVLAYGLLKAGAGVVALPAAEAVVQVGAWGWLVRLVRAYCPWAVAPVADVRAGFGELVRYGLVLSATSAAYAVESGSDPVLFLLARPDGLELTGAFTLWSRFPLLVGTVGLNVTYNAAPTFLAAYAADRGQGAALFGRLLAVVAGLAAAGVVGLGVWLAPFVHHWLDGRYDLPDGPRVALLLAAVVGARMFVPLLENVWYAEGRGGGPLRARWLQAGVKVALGVVLVRGEPISGMAAAGAAGVLVCVVYLAGGLVRAGVLPARVFLAPAALMAAAVLVAGAGGRWTAGAAFWPTAAGIAGTGLVLAGLLAVWLVWTGVVSGRPGWRRPAAAGGGSE